LDRFNGLCLSISTDKRASCEFGYGALATGKETPRPLPPSLEQGDNVGVLIAVLLLILLLYIVGALAVKFLLWLAIILTIVWLVGFFVRGAEGARWYRW
jgi:hypothetical protein